MCLENLKAQQILRIFTYVKKCKFAYLTLDYQVNYLLLRNK